MYLLSIDLLQQDFIGFIIHVKFLSCIIQMAWSVARTTSSTTGMNPVTYNRVLVNLGNAWNPSTNTVTIPRNGYYFLHIGGGVRPSLATYIYLYVNNSIQFNLRHFSYNHNGVDTMSRSGILHLSSGDQVKISCGSNGFYSDGGLQTIFIGFLLY